MSIYINMSINIDIDIKISINMNMNITIKINITTTRLKFTWTLKLKFSSSTLPIVSDDLAGEKSEANDNEEKRVETRACDEQTLPEKLFINFK